MQILEELNNETRRIYIAGSKLAVDDPRITKYIPTLEKMGEKSPIINKLAQKFKALTKSGEPLALIEAGSFLQSVMVTQVNSFIEGDEVEKSYIFKSELPSTTASYSLLSPLITALTKTGSERADVLHTAYKNNIHKDVRITKHIVDGLNDKSGGVKVLLEEIIIPDIAEIALPYIREAYDVKGKSVSITQLKLLCKFNHHDAKELVEEALVEGSKALKEEAIYLLSNFPDKEEELLKYAVGKNETQRWIALKALSVLNSSKGLELTLMWIKNKSYNALGIIKLYNYDSYIQQLLPIMDELLKNFDSNSLEFKCFDTNKVYSNRWERAKDILEIAGKVIGCFKLNSETEALNQAVAKRVEKFLNIVINETNEIKLEYEKTKDNKLNILLRDIDWGHNVVNAMLSDAHMEYIVKFFNGKSQRPENYCEIFYRGYRELSKEAFYDKFAEYYQLKELSSRKYGCFNSAYEKLIGRVNAEPALIIERFKLLDPRWLEIFINDDYIASKIHLLYYDKPMVEKYLQNFDFSQDILNELFILADFGTLMRELLSTYLSNEKKYEKELEKLRAITLLLMCSDKKYYRYFGYFLKKLSKELFFKLMLPSYKDKILMIESVEHMQAIDEIKEEIKNNQGTSTINCSFS